MLRKLIAAALSVHLFAAPAYAQALPPDVKAKILAVERRTGVELHLFGDPDEPAPPAANDNIGPVDPALVLPLLGTLEDVLLTYPERVRGGLLEDVHLFGKLQMRGKPFLGAARIGQKRIDLAIRPGTTDAKLRTTFHHEIAHLLEGNARFPRDEWLALSSDFRGRGSERTEGQQHLELGFVSHYAQVNRHEDFAEMAEVAFSAPARMQELARKYPRLREKLVLLTAVYRAAVPESNLPWLTPQLLAACEALPPFGTDSDAVVRFDDNGNPLPRG